MKLTLDAGKCTGCKICELACSAKHEGVFNPRKARLKIIDRYIEIGRERERLPGPERCVAHKALV